MLSIVVLMLSIVLFNFNLFGQAQGIVANEGITSQLHKDHIGEITFMRGLVPISEYTENDFLKSFEIREDSNLAITTFLNDSLTNFLHKLDTDLSSSELSKNGNYQFSFFVDDKLIYKENLHPMAGSAKDKDIRTVLQLPLASTKGENHWPRFLWRRFFFGNGGEEALENGPHLLRIEMRAYLDHSGVVAVGDLIAKGQIILAIAEPDEVSEDQLALQEIAPNSGWPLSKASFDENKIRELNRKIAQRKFKKITSIVAIKDGELLIEEYFNKANRTTTHNTRSVGKSFASTLTGIAIEDEHILNTNQTLGDFYDLTAFDNYSSEKNNVTLKSLLTMSSGVDGSDEDYSSPGNEENMYPTDNWVKFALDLPMDDDKEIGRNWDYFTAGIVVLGDILDQSVPNGLEAYADTKLFAPLGITNYKWQHTPQNVANTAGGLQMSSLDYAKYGQLYKNGGVWNEVQVLSKNWVEASLTNYFPPNDRHEEYGLLFWRQEFSINGKKYEAFACSGNGGNKIYIFSDLPLVVVITATAYGQPYAHPQVHKIMQQYLLPAIIED